MKGITAYHQAEMGPFAISTLGVTSYVFMTSHPSPEYSTLFTKTHLKPTNTPNPHIYRAQRDNHWGHMLRH